MTKTLVIGDIHGCYDELISMLDRVGLVPTTDVVAVGPNYERTQKQNRFSNSSELTVASSRAR